MKKLAYWTIGIHLITGGFLSALISGLAHKEFDAIRKALSNAQESIETIEKVARLFAPWL